MIKKNLCLNRVLSLICAGILGGIGTGICAAFIWGIGISDRATAFSPFALIPAAKAAESAPLADALPPATDEDILKQKFRAVEKYNDQQKSSEHLRELEVQTITREKSTLPLAPNKLTMINFWGAWCAACIAEMPSLGAFEQTHPQISVIHIAENRDGYLSVRSAADRLGLMHENNYYDQRGFVKRWMNVRVFPTKILISPSGDMLYRLEGNIDWGDPTVQNLFDKLGQTYQVSPTQTSQTQHHPKS